MAAAVGTPIYQFKSAGSSWYTDVVPDTNSKFDSGYTDVAPNSTNASDSTGHAIVAPDLGIGDGYMNVATSLGAHGLQFDDDDNFNLRNTPFSSFIYLTPNLDNPCHGSCG